MLPSHFAETSLAREQQSCLATEVPPVHTLASPTLAHAGWRLGGFEQRPDSCIIFQYSQGSCWNNEGKRLLIVSITAAVLRVEAVYLLPLSVYLARILIFENKA